MLTISQWRYFLCVADLKNITKAAEELYISQQALSKALTAIETDLGAPLFVRSEKGTRLTVLGKRIYPVAKILVNKYDDYSAVIDSLVSSSKYSLSMLFEHPLMQYAVPPDLLACIGDIKIRTDVAEDYQNCYQAVLSGEYDLGMVHRPRNMEKLVYIPVYSEPLVLLMHKSHPLTREKELHIKDLKEVHQVMPNVSASIITDYIEACIDEGFYPKFVYEANHLEIILRYVQENKGICLSGAFGLRSHTEDITYRPLSHNSLSMDLGFIAKPDYMENPHLLSFIRAIRNGKY